MRCGRCGEGLAEGDASQCQPQSSAHPAEIGLDLGGATASFEDWQLDQNLRSIEARLGSWRHDRGSQAATYSRRPQWRFDAAHHGMAAPNYLRRRSVKDRPAGRSGMLVRSVLWLGLLTMVAGGGLLGWSVAEMHAQAWNVGLPLAAGGGTVFLLGLAWQLERIWKNSRYAVQKLRQLDTQMQQLERTTSMLGVTHSSPSQAFYGHLAEQANPHLLLADLKGQLDLLAMNFASR